MHAGQVMREWQIAEQYETEFNETDFNNLFGGRCSKFPLIVLLGLLVFGVAIHK